MVHKERMMRKEKEKMGRERKNEEEGGRKWVGKGERLIEEVRSLTIEKKRERF